MRYFRNQAGVILPFILTVIMVLSALGVAIAGIAISNLRTATGAQNSQEALNIAEAGLNYYLWHLAHNSTDYKDGGTTPSSPPYGPYTHNFYNAAGKKIGTFTLTITPPPTGSTVTTVKSVGQAVNSRGAITTGKRTLQAQLGIPSFASYGLLTGTEVWFGPGENSSGPIHSNVGVHMDGTNNGPVTSANATYKPNPQFGGDGSIHNGVWGNGGPTSQWQFPVPTVDFNSVTANLQSMITQAQANGVYLPSSSKQGYYLKLKSNGTIDIYTVKNETSSGITTTFVRNQTAPANGCLYASDNVWVDATAGWPGRMTIGSGRLPDVPATNTSIKIVDNTTYSALDGSAALGLIAQNNVEVATYAPNNLTVDGALLAQKGHVWFPNNGPVKNNLDFYGSIDSFDYWTWSWVNGGGTVISGYKTDTTTFDTHLTYGPPPCYPTTGAYQILNWRELLNSP